MTITSFTTELPTFLDIANRLERAFAGYAESRERLFRTAYDLAEQEARARTAKNEATLYAWAAINADDRKMLAGERDAALEDLIEKHRHYEPIRKRLEDARQAHEQARMLDDIAYQQLAVAKRLAELAIAAAHQP